MLMMVLMFLGLSSSSNTINAAGSDRRAVSVEYGWVHVWELKAWKDNKVLCEIYLLDEETPTNEDIETYCGSETYEKWLTSPPCTSFLSTGRTSGCSGSYLKYMGRFNQEYEVKTILPGPEVYFRLMGCSYSTWCDTKPSFTVYGNEPLEEYSINQLHILIGDRHFVCQKEGGCNFQLPLTSNKGVWMEYWSVSSYGDESPHETVHLRNLYRDVDSGEYLVDIIDAEYMTNFTAITWDTFPTLSHPYELLYSPRTPFSRLATDHKLFYLAGKLIHTGEAVASGCVDSGLLSNGNANSCGERAAHADVVEWQNQYDLKIIQAATNYDRFPVI